MTTNRLVSVGNLSSRDNKFAIPCQAIKKGRDGCDDVDHDGFARGQMVVIPPNI